ncbi:phosphate acyltransferase PlsX [Brevibacillus dissolubilis]|uniref:phosphate acyltransferase PlsX n=1 Tax=Brevibacillus dissolubilis TaxID=1844116 RepID=UPI0011169CB3|nr:phosphate acyltransferase PlsX [Brevibacillus dissolubilis]
MRISVDAMGGDHAPQSAVEGALLAVQAEPAITIVLVGDEAKIRTQLPSPLPTGIEIHHTTEIIEADDEPVKAVRRKKDSSLVVSVALARDGSVDAAISAGNTGALMTAGLLVAGRMTGIERPALAAFVPNMKRKISLLLDVGANMDAKPQHLVQYGIMGSLYAEKMLQVNNPEVGLLNVGTEEMKGNELAKSTFPLLQAANINFIGNVESRDVMQDGCDVLVCEGFSGNILLKSLEGTASVVFSQLKQTFMSSLINKLAAAVLKSSLTRFRERMDYAEYGGAPLLGLKRPVFKAHGSSDARAIKNAILAAARYVTLDVNGLIQQELEKDQQGRGE